MDETIDANVRDLPATFLFDLGDTLDGYDLVSFSIGYDGAVYVLAVTAPADYRRELTHGLSHPRLHTALPHDFVIFRWDGMTNTVTQTVIRQQIWNYHFVQPLPGGEYLLVVARSAWYGPGDFDLNGKVFTVSGLLAREFLLGDGVDDIQTTEDGKVWIAYMDEGIFGNFGWGPTRSGVQPPRPVGAPGLVAFDRYGNQLYEFQPPESSNYLVSVGALNDSSPNDIWFSASEVKGSILVKISNFQIAGLWRSRGIGGTFALSGDDVLIGGGVGMFPRFRLIRLCGGTMQHELTIRLTNTLNERLYVNVLPAPFTYKVKEGPFAGPYIAMCAGRGSNLFVMSGTCCYRIGVEDVLRLR